MAPVIPNPQKIKSFQTQAAFESWLAKNHARETELWLKIHKKDSGLPSVTAAHAGARPRPLTLADLDAAAEVFVASALRGLSRAARTPAG